MSTLAGPWLAGTFDNDRSIAKAASDALKLVFPTTEKVHGVHIAFQKSILEFGRDAAFHETVQTLSDERNVSSDDAETTYARVVSTSLAVVGSLMRELSIDEQAKESRLYGEVFSSTKLWDFVHYSDAGVRRSTHRLIQTCLGKQPNSIEENIKSASVAYVYKGLHSDQTSSALDFVQTLDALTVTLPTIWTDAYTGKKPAISRFRYFLKQGSQSAPADFWRCLSELVPRIPAQVLPTAPGDVTDVLFAARNGVSKRGERFSASSAWAAYFNVVAVLISTLSDAEAETVLRSQVMPVLQQYLYPAPETAEWSITSARVAWIVSKVASIQRLAPLLESEWPLLADQLAEVAKMSQPEQSNEFDKSQTHVAATGERWAELQREIWESDYDLPTTLDQTFVEANTRILDGCVGLLKSRNGKPYGAAAVIEVQLRTCAKYLMLSDGFRANCIAFLRNDVPKIILGLSQRHLVRILYALRSDSAFPGAFHDILQSVLDANESVNSKLNVLRTMFVPGMPTEATMSAKAMPELQSFLRQNTSSQSGPFAMDLFARVVKLDAASMETIDDVLSNLTAALATVGQAEHGLSALEVFERADTGTLSTFMSTPGSSGEHLLPNLLRLEQSPNDIIADKAAALSSKLYSAIGEATSDSRYGIVLQNLERVSRTSLQIDALHDLTHRLLGSEHRIQNPSDILPSFEVWRSSLCATIKPLKPSSALLSPLGGSVYLLQRHSANPENAIQYDAEGFSQALRISMYVTRLLAETHLLQQLGQQKATALALIYLTVLVAEDNVSISGANDLWSTESGRDGEMAVLDFISEADKILNDYWKILIPDRLEDESTEFAQFFAALEELRIDQSPTSPVSYYAALSIAKAHTTFFELHGVSAERETSSEAILRSQRSAKQPLSLVAYIAGFSQSLSGSQTLSRFCNELVAELTDVTPDADEIKTMQQLISLNTILHTGEDAIAGIAKQRLIFLVKHILPLLDESASIPIKAEICKALAELLPGMQDMYGEHWEQALSFLTHYWTSNVPDMGSKVVDEDRIVLTNASLKLFRTLMRLSKLEEPNDDLVEALQEKRDQVHDGLIHLLICADGVNDEMHQPLMITHEILARQLALLPYKALPNTDELYPLIYTPSRPIEQAAFALLHEQIPAAQEQISFDAALENRTAQLPDELLSLIVEAPTLDSLVDASFDRVMPRSLRSYLDSWRLVFDHFLRSSHRVKSDYIEQLKDGTYLAGLLNFTFDFLGHTRGRPVDPSKFDIQDYVADMEPSPEKDVQWLLNHLYLLALTHLPTSVRNYYLDIRSRQTSLAVESWTAKHISPFVIDASLQAVADWSVDSVTDDPDYEKMSVRVGMRSKEVNVSYEIDEQTMAIKVVLPEAYPLASTQVLSVSRVAVKEEKWQSWIRNCQGVIIFSVCISHCRTSLNWAC